MTAMSTISLSVQIGLRLIGFWPNTPCALLFRGLWILTISIVQIYQYWWIIIHFRTDSMSYLMDGLSVTIEYTVMSLKLIILWLNSRAHCLFIHPDRVNCRSIFYDALAAMAADWKEAANNEVHIMTNKANLSRRLSNMIIGLHSVAVLCFGIEVLASHIDDYNGDGTETSVRAFTLKLQLPAQCNESPLYELVMCLEFLHQMASSTVTGVLNSLLITLILHTSGQIEILCDTLRDIYSKKNNQELSFSMKALISKHQNIIIFSNKIERIFSYIALIQFLSSTLLTCCVGFTVITTISVQDSDTIDTAALIKAIVFYMAAAVEAFTFCFCGEYLSAKVGTMEIFILDFHYINLHDLADISKMIGDAAYKSIWYNLKSNESKFILLIILRSQRRLTITAGKMMDLSLEGFTSILKTSVSYVSVLHAMY